MERRVPPGLSDVQRNVLAEFFAGHISAGQLTERLGIEATTPHMGESAEHQRFVEGQHPSQRATGGFRALRRRLGLTGAP